MTGLKTTTWLAAALFLSAGVTTAVAQSITTDGTLGPAKTLIGPNYTIGADLGRQVGGNLFQSFGLFGIAAGESANFTGPAGVANIIGRVTGGSPSAIDGRIRSSIAGANLYLINPFGIVFGPGATVAVGGSFQAATASYLRMADGSLFQATRANGSSFSAAPPAAFGFLGAPQAGISVTGSTLNAPGGLSLVGGSVSLTASRLTAPGGTIHIASAGGPGEVPVDPTQPITAAALGAVTIAGGSAIKTEDGGSVFIRAGTVSIDASRVVSRNRGSSGGGQLSLWADGQIALSNGAQVASTTSGSGAGAQIAIITGGQLSLASEAAIVSKTIGNGTGGTIGVTAGEIAMQDRADLLATTSGAGPGGMVDVRVGGALAIESGASLGTISSGTGNAGAVDVVAGSISIDMTAGSKGSALSGIGSNTGGNGNAGSVTVNSAEMSIINGGEIFSSTFGRAAGGDVSVNVPGLLSISGSPMSRFATGIGSNGSSKSAGNTGNVSVIAGELSITGTGEISIGVFGAGNGGNISVNVAGLLSIAGSPQGRGATGIIAEADPGSIGNAGNISVSAGSLAIATEGGLSSTTLGAGKAGSVTVSVTGLLSIVGGPTGRFAVGIASDSDGANSGAAGSVVVNAGELLIADHGAITTGTFGAGAGGNLSVTVTGLLSIVGPARERVLTGIAAQTNFGSSGNAGQVAVAAGQLSISGGGSISTAAIGSGNGGNVMVTADSIALSGGRTSRQITAFSAGVGTAGNVVVVAGSLSVTDGAGISTTAASANGGNVSISIGGLLYLRQGSITTSVLAENGNGGNIAIEATAVVLAAGSEIVARAVRGHGGNIGIDAGAFIPEIGSLVSASSQLGVSGTVAIAGEETGLNGSLIVLPGDLRTPPVLLREACADRGSRPRSSLSAGAAVGVPPDLDTPAPAIYLGGRDRRREAAVRGLPRPVAALPADRCG